MVAGSGGAGIGAGLGLDGHGNGAQEGAEAAERGGGKSGELIGASCSDYRELRILCGFGSMGSFGFRTLKIGAVLA
jgi:hypothetical protein